MSAFDQGPDWISSRNQWTVSNTTPKMIIFDIKPISVNLHSVIIFIYLFKLYRKNKDIMNGYKYNTDKYYKEISQLYHVMRFYIYTWIHGLKWFQNTFTLLIIQSPYGPLTKTWTSTMFLLITSYTRFNSFNFSLIFSITYRTTSFNFQNVSCHPEKAWIL